MIGMKTLSKPSTSSLPQGDTKHSLPPSSFLFFILLSLDGYFIFINFLLK